MLDPWLFPKGGKTVKPAFAVAHFVFLDSPMPIYIRPFLLLVVDG